eukprot:COSAG06_NODE_36301_length_449_cov_0.551429_2_plen_57_part_01
MRTGDTVPPFSIGRISGARGTSASCGTASACTPALEEPPERTGDTVANLFDQLFVGI